MEMDKERLMILEMVAGGKISAEDAEKLFVALESSSPKPPPAAARSWDAEPGGENQRMENILHDLGVNNPTPRLVRETRAHGFTPEYLNDVKSLGMKFSSLDKLIALRSSRVSKELVRELREMGFKDLDLDTLVQMGIHHVSADDIRQLRELGVAPAEGLEGFIRMRILNISPKYVAEMQSAGLGKLTIEQIFECKIHHISADFVREIVQAGYPNLWIEELVACRIHRVHGEYIRELQSAGYSGLTIDQLTACRIHHVSADDIRELRAAGFNNLTIEEIIELRRMHIHPQDLQALSELEAELASTQSRPDDAEKTVVRPEPEVQGE